MQAGAARALTRMEELDILIEREEQTLRANPRSRNCTKCGAYFLPAEDGREHRRCEDCKLQELSKPKLGQPMTLREQQVTTLVWQGLKNRQIAKVLRTTAGTVKRYIHGAMVKTGASSRVVLALTVERNKEKFIVCDLAQNSSAIM